MKPHYSNFNIEKVVKLLILIKNVNKDKNSITPIEKSTTTKCDFFCVSRGCTKFDQPRGKNESYTQKIRSSF